MPLDPHTMMTCPYNMSHQVEKYKMQFHLEKCRKQNPKSRLVACPFDATHIVPEPELDFHLNVCEEQRLMHREMYDADTTSEFRPSVANAALPAPTAECWDDDDYQPYNPSESLAKATNVIRKIKGETPSVRRQFREEQRLKYNADHK